ncbi:MAG: hypothetical protein OEU50_20265 [Gammaproteobacteria bacterium]|nr:hypothetical protein [Gammaproteobacteria bacterium]
MKKVNLLKNRLLPGLFLTLLVTALPVAADLTEGTILALDRKAKTLVLTDRSVWALEDMKTALPAGLQAGDRIEIEFESDEDGVLAIQGIRIPPPETVTRGASDVTEGTVLVFDRKANILVLTDRTAWALEMLMTAVPADLMAGDRVVIEYESDEDGISSIKSIKLGPK